MSYGASRAKSISFGSVSLQPASTSSSEGAALPKTELRLRSVTELGRFPPSPYRTEFTPAGFRRLPQTVAEHERAAAALQAEIGRRLAVARRKEVVIFIHGYNNSFADAAVATGDICRSLQNEFVCIALTWPAGGSGGVFFGYNVDRESGEFAVADIKKAIRIISTTPGIERVHIIAHSRGTDVLASAMQQLNIETYVGKTSLFRRFKIANVVLFAPDIDLDVASTKMFGAVSDPDLAYGTKARPYAALPSQGATHLTIYSSANDRALGLSTFLFGSVIRLGQLAVGANPFEFKQSGGLGDLSLVTGIVDFIEFQGSEGFIGHSFFLSNPLVGEDLVALIRDRREVGDPDRPLVEVKRPFWRIVENQKQAQSAPRQARPVNSF